MSLQSSSYFSPERLCAERLSSPLGLNIRNPQLSWKLRWDERGAAQRAVHIVAAASHSELLNGEYLWDSGKVRTDSSEMTYGGAALSSRQRVYWKVQVWDELDRVTDWSEVAFLEMGLLTPEDWNSQAAWLGNHGITVPLYRLSFQLDQVREHICTARLYSTGIGYYEPRLNGKKIGTQALAPEYTDYDKRIVYNTFDIEKQLCTGENVLGIILAGGYATRYQYGTPVFRAQLEIVYHDGQKQLVDTSSGTWMVSPGPWRDCDIFNGEWYDARLEQPSWDMPGFIAGESLWHEVKPSNPCSSTDTPAGILVGTSNEPICVTEDLPARSIKEVKPGVYVVDFGQNFAGWVKVRARGVAGSGVCLRFAELLKQDGSVDQINLRSARNIDHYILRGEGEEAWEPRFTYHGFRYVQVEGVPDLPEQWKIVGRVVHSDVPRRGRFECSDERLTRLHLNADWTLRSNMVSVFTDCPQRDERQGWFADAHLSAETALHHFDPGAFFHKWMDDIRDVQDAERGHRWSPTAPVWPPSGRHQPPFFVADPDKQADVVWTAAGTLIPWFVYLYNGDLRLVEAHFPAIEQHLEFLSTQSEAPITPFNQFGDWLHSTFQKSPDPTNPTLLSTVFFLEQCCKAALMAKALGNVDSQKRWELQSEKIIQAIRTQFYDAKNHTFGSQTVDALALCIGYAPVDEQDAILAHLIEDIQDNCDGHLATGIIGTKFLLESLCEAGHFDVAFGIVMAEGYPGWMEMLKNGATTITERWNYTGDYGMNSHNHPVLGIVSGWMFRWLAGIRVDPQQPAYRHFWIAPETPALLNYAQAELDTVRGVVFARWERFNEGLNLKVRVPQGAEATIIFPAVETRIDQHPPQILEGGISITQNDFIRVGEPDALTGRATARVSSGQYTFSIG